jgi:hypothetical protein
MSFVLTLGLLLPSPTDDKPPAKPDRDTLIKSARSVMTAIVAAGRENSRRPVPRKDDQLTEYYVRAAAAAARRLPEKQRATAMMLALGVALDRSSLMRKNPVTAIPWRRVETDAERTERLKVLGTPTIHRRHDLAQHFSVSAALTALVGAKAAEAAGILKELLDAEPGGSGFSFADLAADLSGVAFAQRMLNDPARLADMEKSFSVAAFVVSPKGLTEDLTIEQFTKKYGSVRDARFRKELETLRKKVRTLPGHKE